jgi:hypothetical protein
VSLQEPKCANPPCPLFAGEKQDAAWRMAVRQHVASGLHSGDREEVAMFLRIMEREFQRAMGGKGHWEGPQT